MRSMWRVIEVHYTCMEGPVKTFIFIILIKKNKIF